MTAEQTQPLTLQNVFDAALFGIRGQGYKRSTMNRIGAACAYRGQDGLKCGIGHAIKDDEAAQRMDRATDSSIRTLLVRGQIDATDLFGHLSIDALSDIQAAHDADAGCREVDREIWEAKMMSIAETYGLTYTPPTI